MCGIIGYNGKKDKAISIILEGLKNLEYRGYDSAGIAYVRENNITNIKSKGAIVNLEEKIDIDIPSNMGIGHTRWATHGEPSELNAHPHTVGKITLVHNGIIENYQDIKNELLEKGVKFVSETDTEVAAALFNDLYESTHNPIEMIRQFKMRAQGSYALAIIISDDLNKLYVLKNASPLIIGVAEDGYYVASDVPAILKNTNKYITLEDGDYAEISVASLKIFDTNDKEKNYKVSHFEGDDMLIDKNGYEHFMLKEIHEEPIIIKKLIDKYKNALDKLPNLKNYDDVTIVACGSAMHAGLIGKHLIEKNLNIPVNVEIASEFRYKKLFLNEKSLVIAISQSGETADTLAAVKIARTYKAHTLGIVNVKESSIAREVDEVVYTEAGSEIAVATTKAYLAQVMILTLISLRESDKDLNTLDSLPIYIEKLINENEKYILLANNLKEVKDMYFIGRQIDYAICMEASLKMKEISYIHSECYAAGELKHGTISLIENGTNVIAIITDKNIAEKTISNIKEVKSRGAIVTLVISSDLDFENDCYDEKIIIPSMMEDVMGILSIIPLQLIAYETAKIRGCSIDKPKNLAKSVTVE